MCRQGLVRRIDALRHEIQKTEFLEQCLRVARLCCLHSPFHPRRAWRRVADRIATWLQRKSKPEGEMTRRPAAQRSAPGDSA